MSGKKIKFIVETVDNGNASLKYEDGQILVLPIADLPENIKIGDVLFSEFTATEEEKTVRDMAKEVINEMLNPE